MRLLIVGLAVLVGQGRAVGGDRPQAPPQATEFHEMLAAILAGSKMGPQDGWFHPGVSRYSWAWLATEHGVKPTDGIPKSKFRGPPDLFARLDRDGDGVIRADDLDWSPRSAYLQQLGHARQILRRADRDGDGSLSREEWGKLFDKAAGKDGSLSPERLKELLYPPDPPRLFSNAADEPGMLVLLRGLFKGEIGSPFPGPNVGDSAPDFTLKSPDGATTVTLSAYRGKKPVVLVFGNYSCGPFRGQYPAVEKVKKAYGDRVAFVGVYVREAHPTDGWRMLSNDLSGVSIPQPGSTKERCTVASRCAAALKMTMPLVVDEVNDRVGHAYSGMPSRLMLIDRAGTVVYKTGRGPFGFKPGELDQMIAMHLLDEHLTKPVPQPGGESARVPLASAAAAWQALPDLAAGEKAGPLPSWARAYAVSLPRTTAAVLELDYAQRAKSPLPPRLRAMVRWAAAAANRSPYGEAYALFDLRAAGATDADVTALRDDPAKLPEADRAAVAFARKLTLRAYAITDAEFEALRKLQGDANAVAIVLCAAYANFQDRLLLTLGLTAVEPGGPLPPIPVAFRKPYQGDAGTPPRDLPPPGAGGETPETVTDSEWLKLDPDVLRQSMADQQKRSPRLPVPAFDEVKKKLPPGTYKGNKPLRINWSLVCLGYQPELTLAWLNCLRTFEAEAKQDRVFEETLFWVVTRSLACFY